MSDKLENTKSLILAIQSSMNFSIKRALKVRVTMILFTRSVASGVSMLKI